MPWLHSLSVGNLSSEQESSKALLKSHAKRVTKQLAQYTLPRSPGEPGRVRQLMSRYDLRFCEFENLLCSPGNPGYQQLRSVKFLLEEGGTTRRKFQAGDWIVAEVDRVDKDDTVLATDVARLGEVLKVRHLFCTL